jgi:hypothetical protein
MEDDILMSWIALRRKQEKYQELVLALDEFLKALPDDVRAQLPEVETLLLRQAVRAVIEVGGDDLSTMLGDEHPSP